MIEPQGENRYRLLHTLGQGGFGTVYLAEVGGIEGFKRRVALKVLSLTPSAPADALLRFRDEARILAQIQHRAVVRVENLCRLYQDWAVVMEYVPGVDLTKIVRDGPLPPRVALEIVEEIASALHAAYACPSAITGEPLHLLHRDIKPSNLRITPQGDIKVLDFGIARGDFPYREAQTKDAIVGSLRYMAPERIEGIDTTSGDVYSLGLVLAELLTGNSRDPGPKHPSRYGPFLNEVTDDLRCNVATMAPEMDSDLLLRLEDLVCAMLALLPEERPTAKTIELEVGRLAEQIGGIRLRPWAEINVRAILEREPPPEQDESTGKILVTSGDLSLHDIGANTTELIEAATPPPPPMTSAPPADSTGPVVPPPGPMGFVPRPRRFRPGVVLALGFIAAVLAVVAVALGLGRAVEPGPRTDHLAKAAPISGSGEDAVSHDAPAALPAEEPPPRRESRTPARSAVAVPPEPAPAQPATEPSPGPAVALAPASPALTPDAALPEPPHVTIEGDATRISLESTAGSYSPEKVPPGTYTVMAWFGDARPVKAATIELSEGERVRLRCNARWLKCTASEE